MNDDNVFTLPTYYRENNTPPVEIFDNSEGTVDFNSS